MKKKKNTAKQKTKQLKKGMKSLCKLPEISYITDDDLTQANSRVGKYLLDFKRKSVINDIIIKLQIQETLISLLDSIEMKEIKKEPVSERVKAIRILTDCL